MQQKRKKEIRDCTKVAYGSELEAYLAMETIQQKGRIQDSTPHRSYQCNYCGKWHLTSKVYRKNKEER
jgi:hypothetical protein